LVSEANQWLSFRSYSKKTFFFFRLLSSKSQDPFCCSFQIIHLTIEKTGVGGKLITLIYNSGNGDNPAGTA
jgi:hypothetical protein